ncbi:hypothetical protein [Acinetobacter sp. ANC 3882]|uniref:hypothetical protein n=1 Tax=Acinetobacter sp. ANC 3882 TaxID=2923423 RepID=UPI001F4AB5E6|nr:hypothetical protein [Acinetobacter sp. ANC 3882]MCH7315841.1 hypothetical protein [Acinetobacter sp. ANC 3882]
MAQILIENLFDFDARALAYKINKHYKIYSFMIDQHTVMGVAQHIFFQEGDELYAVINAESFTDISPVYAIYHPEQNLIYSLPQHGFTLEGLKRRQKTIGLAFLIISLLVNAFFLFNRESNGEIFIEAISSILISGGLALLAYVSVGLLYKKAAHESMQIYKAFGFNEPEKIDFRSKLYEHKPTRTVCPDIAYLERKIRE